MKLAIFSDLHGNDYAFEAILEDAHDQKVDLIICAGDALNPFPGSKRIWHTLREQEIPMILGNHEEYIMAMCDPTDPLELQDNIQFLPIRLVVQDLSCAITTDLAALPMTLTLSGPHDDVLICHASPDHTRHSIYWYQDEAIITSLQNRSEPVIVAGHIHLSWQKRWRDKWLLICGGGGLPLNGQPTAQYLILTHQQGNWSAEHRSIAYDHQSLLQQVHKSRFLINGGPLAWLLYDELWTAERRLIPFFTTLGPDEKPVTMTEWRRAVRRHLETIGRWEYLAPLITPEGYI